MFIFSNLFGAVAMLLHYALTFYMYVIIARAILSWVSPDPYNPIVRFINNITEPVLYQIRKRLPVTAGGIDFSPILVIFVIIFFQRFIVQSLFDLSQTLK